MTSSSAQPEAAGGESPVPRARAASEAGTGGGEAADITARQAAITEARTKARAKLVHWICLSVILAVLPTIGNSFIAFFQNKTPSLAEMAVRGDLYVVCMGLTGTAIGQAVLRKNHHRHYLVAFLTIFSVLLLILLVVLSAAKDAPGVDRELLGYTSLWFFGGTVLITGTITYLCELELPS
ncbi:hypothetical protein ACF1DV_01685 [Streptomyces achromogenes]|uniref:hypothetical protein n=1 Tax=Streptomyces achromogenes TaxID=67255 RepID=UPI0037031AA9